MRYTSFRMFFGINIRKEIFLPLILSSAALLLILILPLPFLKNSQQPNIESEREKIIEAFNQRLVEFKKARYFVEGERLKIAELKGPQEGFAVLSIARENPSWPPGVGAGGLVAIAKKVGFGWEVSMMGENDFQTWLDEIPESLFSSELKKCFDEVKYIDDPC